MVRPPRKVVKERQITGSQRTRRSQRTGKSNNRKSKKQRKKRERIVITFTSRPFGLSIEGDPTGTSRNVRVSHLDVTLSPESKLKCGDIDDIEGAQVEQIGNTYVLNDGYDNIYRLLRSAALRKSVKLPIQITFRPDPKHKRNWKLGKKLQVYSVTWGKWCNGVIRKLDGTDVIVQYKVNEDNIKEKRFRKQSPKLRSHRKKS